MTTASYPSRSAYVRSRLRIPKSTTRTPSGRSRPARRRTTSTPKASSPRKMLPTPATRTRGRFMTPPISILNEGLHFVRPEEEAVSWLAQGAEVAARVVIDGDGQVHLPLVILLDRVHRGRL